MSTDRPATDAFGLLTATVTVYSLRVAADLLEQAADSVDAHAVADDDVARERSEALRESAAVLRRTIARATAGQVTSHLTAWPALEPRMGQGPDHPGTR